MNGYLLPGGDAPLNEADERIELIRKLCEFHPGVVQEYNKNLAHYTGGMKDDGDLDFRYCLFKATIAELNEAVSNLMDKRVGNTSVWKNHT